MPKDFVRLLLPVLALMAVSSVAILAQDTTLIPNNTNACISFTYKFYTPNMTNPTLIIIDRRVTFNPVTGCMTMAYNAFCGDDPGTPMLLSAQAIGTQITMSPACVWDCAVAGCGTITTDSSDGLPVELMDFEIEDDHPSVEADGADAGAPESL